MDARLAGILGEIARGRGRVVALTGAGISAESGIPTFRGSEGYWVVGSRNYVPEEMATRRMFDRVPEEVWRWYLYRFGVCRNAEPNAGHAALVGLEQALSDRFTLVTQNIDGLHHRAGSRHVLCIHGDGGYVRCARECGVGVLGLPDLTARPQEVPLSAADRERLTCPRCGSWLRPHVLWFDECYDEHHYRADSALRAVEEAHLLLVVGTSGATSLPMHLGLTALKRGIALVDVNPESNPFAQMAARSPRGFVARGSACECLPEIVRALGAGT